VATRNRTFASHSEIPKSALRGRRSATKATVICLLSLPCTKSTRKPTAIRYRRVPFGGRSGWFNEGHSHRGIPSLAMTIKLLVLPLCGH
jgi:hypothetical protein